MRFGKCLCVFVVHECKSNLAIAKILSYLILSYLILSMPMDLLFLQLPVTYAEDQSRVSTHRVGLAMFQRYLDTNYMLKWQVYRENTIDRVRGLMAGGVICVGD